MRYILLKKTLSFEEIRSRQEYLYDVFKIYTIPFYYENYIELRSVPKNYCDIVFINGHNNQVYSFLKNEEPTEKDIILITCYQGLVATLNFPGKCIYFSNTTTDKLNGKEYGFDFEITNSELDLYNCSYTLIKDKLDYSFERSDKNG